MFFDFEDRHTDTPSIESAISRREGILLSVVLHVAVLALVIYAPRIPVVRDLLARAQLAAAERQAEWERFARENARFVFVQPRLDQPAPAPPPRAELSDQDRAARTIERPPDAANLMPYLRGNSTERVEAQAEERAKGRGPGETAGDDASAVQDGGERQGTDSASIDSGRSAAFVRPDGGAARAPSAGGSLGDALRNLQRYVQGQSFDNPRGGQGAFGPAIQFDTKGVEFGPWIRRFVAQIKRNWLIPYAAMSLSGHVVITFNVHKDGRLTDLTIVGPSAVDGFNNAAFNALVSSNPTQPLPPEYPSDKAFFTVTFFYNEAPPSQE